MDELSIKASIQGLGIPALKYFKSTGSTNDIGLEWLRTGASEFSMVVADQQTSGRGRLQREWVTKASSALACSFILHPKPEEQTNLQLVSILGGLCVCDFLENSYNIHATIKWPNDVLIDRKKVCGVLTETQWTDGGMDGLVLGIGVNILKESVPEKEQTHFPATSIEESIRKEPDRLFVLAGIIKKLIYWRPRLAKLEFMEYWRSHLAFKNEVIRVEQEGQSPVIGTCHGITSTGELEILMENGQTHLFSSGDVHVRAYEVNPE